MEDGEEWRPLLELDVDTAVGKEARGYPHGLTGLSTHKWLTSLDVKKRFRVEVVAGLARFLNLPLERLCRYVSMSRHLLSENLTILTNK